MKKFFKFAASAALLCGTIAGGIYAYRKFFAPDPFDDDLDDDLEEDAAEDSKVSGRGYVSLTTEETEDTASVEDAAEKDAEESSAQETPEA